MRDRDVRIAAIAARQHGAFSGAQAVVCGFPRRTVQFRVRSGVWVRTFGDAYRLAGAPTGWEQNLMSAWLACGTPSAVCGSSAAALWGLDVRPGPRPEVAVPSDRNPSVPGVDVVRTRRWGPREVVGMGPLRVTSVVRTLLDLVPVLSEGDLEDVLDQAHRQGMRLQRLTSYLRANRGVPGVSVLASLAEFRDPDRPIESHRETQLFRALRLGGLPLPQPQYWIRTRTGRRRLDFAYPQHRLALEFASFAFHDTGRAKFDDDRARDNELSDAGWDRRFITSGMLDRPAELIVMVGVALGLTPSRWRPTP